MHPLVPLQPELLELPIENPPEIQNQQDNLPSVEEVVQAQILGQEEIDDAPEVQEEVLEMDGIIDLDEELVPPPPAPAPVEVHIPHV